jgi:hypothetical protein
VGIEGEDLNDDRIGRVMDKLSKYGLTKLFLIIALYQFSMRLQRIKLGETELQG